MTEAAQYIQPIQPPAVFDTYQRLSMLIHALSKKGKSTLSATAPKPVLVLDAEGSWRFIPVRQRHWDPMTESMPVYDGTWDACIVHVREWATVAQAYHVLTTQWTPFVSVVIDSITEIQRRCKQNLKGAEAMKIQDWGTLLVQMDNVIRGFRDLTLLPHLNVRCVVFIAETREGNGGRWVPYMQGQIAISLPYWVDVCGFLFPDHETDENGQPTREVRRLWIGPHPQYESGERVQGALGHCITVYRPEPGQVGRDIEVWMKTIFGIAETQNGSVLQ